MAIDNFVYNAEHGVIICRQCESCLVAKEGSWVSHLRNRPHSMKGELLVRTLEHFHSFGNLSSVDDLRRRAADRRRLRQPCRPIDGLALYEGFICNCTKTCFFSTRRLDKIRNHMSVHGKKAKQHSDATPLWRACKLQNYFTAKPLLDYFEVDGAAPIMLQEAAPTMIEEAAPTIPQEAAPTMIEEAAPTIPQEAAPLDSSSSSSSLPTSLPTSLLTSSPSTLSSFSSSYLSLSFPTARATTVAQHARSQFFQSIKERMRHSSELSYVVQDPLRCAALRDRDPWLVTTGFALHLDGLLDAEIRSSYALPASLEGNVRLDGSSEEASDRDLRRILVAAEHTLRDAYRLCNDTSHRRKLTQQRAITLNQLRLVDARDLGATRGVPFRASKHSNTLNVYFHLTKQLLTYYYRVVYRPAGHFTSNTEGHPLPHDEIQPTSEQSQAMDTIIAVLRRQDALNNVMIIDDDDDPAATAELDGQLRKAIRDLLVSLICCWVGDTPFESALLSFCAMRSLTLAQPIDGSFNARGLCKWREPKNYLGDLSALIWTSQLMLFDSVCFACKDNRQQILARLQDTCRAYCHDMAESPLGQMLQWTSYLFAAFMDTMVKPQACWSIDGLTVQYKGTELHLDHISQLVVSEYKVASRILYEDLLLGLMADMPHIESWRLQDYLDQAEQGASSRTDARQADLLAETQLAILNKIEASPELQRTFVRQLDLRRPAFCFCPNAIALYEKRIQDFLERLLVMIHISIWSTAASILSFYR
ncbi:uncharacterized protein UMAG_10980 [Mycosarcoma maydis]|uniref:Uncharacterized protein n=1 Tax=Mycosarcoma maydis TaxID=5270 RepID=A0A0D1BUU7_MYCMD|nr:uncharacterized protein UMAG_10980 [Ustilago maydis 521]KIS65887.1 hypothetical protein UMAG_10980 [Ustilago maydis 521]|eukprot:XP_011392614.1 hypothetical protein UMAG_10980 [Ustilago maydis 521]